MAVLKTITKIFFAISLIVLPALCSAQTQTPISVGCGCGAQLTVPYTEAHTARNVTIGVVTAVAFVALTTWLSNRHPDHDLENDERHHAHRRVTRVVIHALRFAR